MARRIVCFAAVLMLSAGCGESPASSPAEQALRELQAGRYDEAIATCNEAIQLNPKDAEAYHYRGRAYHYRNQEGDLERAIADFTQSIGIAPKEPETYYSRSIAYRDSGDADKSAADETTARQLDSQLKETYAELADITPPGAAAAVKSDESTPDTSPDGASATPGRPAAKAAADELSTPSQPRERVEPATPDTGLSSPEADPQAGSQDSLRRLLSVPQFKLPQATGDSADTKKPAASPPPQRGKAGKAAPQRAGERSRAATTRVVPDTEFSTPMPRSPWATRGQYSSPADLQPYGTSPYQRPIQSPFPQSQPRATGFSPDRQQGPPGNEPRQLYNNPYSAPTNHLPGAYHEDYNP